MKNTNESSVMLQMVEIDQNKFAVEVIEGNVKVNLTQMGKPFGRNKRPKNWLRTQESIDYLNLLSVAQKRATADLVLVKQGGYNQGTWCTDFRIAIRYAQFLSPEFSIQVDGIILQLILGKETIAKEFMGVEPVIHNGRSWYYYRDVLKSMGFSIKSGAVAKRKRLNEKHFIKLFGRNFIDLDYCQQLKQEALKYGIQLELPFDGHKQLKGGDNV